MAVQVKDLGQSAQKWSRNAGGASQEYASNAVAGAQRWAANTAAASTVFQQAVSSGNIGARFAAGVRRAGAEKYSRRVQTLGQTRYTTGVGEAESDWQTGFSPYAQTIAGLTLAPRRPRGDPGNYQRVQQIGQALNARRLANLGTQG